MWEKLANILGGTFFGGVSEVIKTFVTDPTERLKAEAALLTLQINTQKEVAALEASDRDSARKREMAVGDKTTRNLAYLYTAGYFGVLYACWAYGIPKEGHDVFVTLLGVLTAAQAAIMNYYFGSSSGSTSKSNLIEKLSSSNGAK
jgi:4-hydroxybenzoate polyprenyltransferase